MTNDKKTTLRSGIDLSLDPSEAFEMIVQELGTSLARQGLHLEAGPTGRIVQDGFEVGRIVSWEPGARILLEWRQASWEPAEVTELELRFDRIDGGVRLTLEHRRWGGLIGESEEIAGWFVSEVAAPLLRATSPEALGDWITDRRARRPSGAQSRGIYREPLYHLPNFRVILSELALTSRDHLLEVGCGGGALLKEALRSGCRAAGIDHSSEMVQLARDENHEAVAAGRLKVLEGNADRLPFENETFTCATMTGVLGFLPDPLVALKEIRRVLGRGGRLVVMGSDVKWKGTPAAPEPMASRLKFYSDDELSRLARGAGFNDVRVVRRDLESFAREVGVPEEHLSLFAGTGAPFLLARKE
jgi:SAM-dependent methyltransferase